MFALLISTRMWNESHYIAIECLVIEIWAVHIKTAIKYKSFLPVAYRSHRQNLWQWHDITLHIPLLVIISMQKDDTQNSLSTVLFTILLNFNTKIVQKNYTNFFIYLKQSIHTNVVLTCGVQRFHGHVSEIKRNRVTIPSPIFF